jgi:hypothetical protein
MELATAAPHKIHYIAVAAALPAAWLKQLG